MKIVCQCGEEMKNDKTGMVWIERLEDGTPYKSWSCDRMLCKSCGNLTYRTGNQPMQEKHEPGFLVNLDAAEKYGLIVGGDI